MAVLAVLVMAMVASTAAAAEPQCLRYEPDVVSLKGAVIYRTFSDASGRPERVPLLLLDDSICVEASKGELSDVNVDEGDEIVVHLNMDPVAFGREQTLSGRRALALGTLYHRHTAHHHADLVLMVKDLKVENK